MKSKFRMLGLIEASSLLVLLFIAMPLKYLAGIPEAVRVVGMIHGLLFVVYCLGAQVLRNELQWSQYKVALAVFISCIPLGPFLFDRKLFPGR